MSPRLLLVPLLTATALVALPARADEPRRIFVVATGADEASDRVAAAVEEIARQAVRGDRRFALESLRARDAPPVDEALAEAAHLVAEGKRAYDELETEAAVERLSRAVDLYLAHMDALVDKTPLHRAIALLGSVYHQSGETDEARRLFRLLATLSPTYTLSDKDHPPSDAKLLLDVQDELAFAEPGSVRLSVDGSSPAAAVWLDGVYRGSTPLSLDDLEPGAHAYLLRREGYARVAGRFEVDDAHDLSLALRPLAGQAALSAALREVSREPPGEGAGSDDDLTALAALGGEADEVLLAVVAPDGGAGAHQLRLARVSTESPRVLAHMTAPVDEARLDEDVAKLVTALLAAEAAPLAPGVARSDVETDLTPWIVAGSVGGAIVVAVAGGALIWLLSAQASNGVPAGYDPNAAARRHVLGF